MFSRVKNQNLPRRSALACNANGDKSDANRDKSDANGDNFDANRDNFYVVPYY